jgi:Cysteine-rich secretory protein family
VIRRVFASWRLARLVLNLGIHRGWSPSAGIKPTHSHAPSGQRGTHERYIIMTKHTWILAMSASLALSQAACVAESTEANTDAANSDANAATASAQQLCVNTINSYRAKLKLKPLARGTSSEACANNEARQDSVSGKPHGAFGQCGEWAQNECPGWPGTPAGIIPGCLAQMWAEGPGSDFNTHGHYISMSSTKYTTVSCGFATTATGKVWAVQNFK